LSGSTCPIRREQRRFAGAVAAHDTQPPTGLQGDVDIGQQQAFAATQGEIAKRDHAAILTALFPPSFARASNPAPGRSHCRYPGDAAS
jgi:hypothetical protein